MQKFTNFFLKKVSKLEPKFTNGDKILSRFTKYNLGDLHIKDMENRVTNEELNDFNKSNILFALGKAYEDTGEFEKSFKALEKCKLNNEKNNKIIIFKLINIFLKRKKIFKHDEN